MTRRVLGVVVAVTVLAVVAFFVPAALAIKDTQEREELLELQREASIVAGRVPPSGPIDTSILQPIVDSRHRLGLYDRDGSLLGGVGPEPPDAIVRVGIRGSFAEGYVGDDVVAVVPLRLRPDGTSLAMRIEAPRGEYLRSLLVLGAFAFAIIGVAAAVAVWLARRLNRPIDELRSWAAAGDDEHREPPPPTGIAELDALRHALLDRRSRIEELLRRERSFSSHVSHQLRTPVAAMRVAVESELAAPRSDPTAVLTETLGQLDRLESTITSLLALARHADRPVARSELAPVTTTAVERWRSVARHSDRELAVTTEPIAAWCDGAAVGHVLDVLIDNALQHGRGRVSVRCGPSGDRAIVEVADEGPRPTANDVFADRGGDSPHGIGLRLARTLAESARGRLELVDSPTTTFRLTLPMVLSEPPRPPAPTLT